MGIPSLANSVLEVLHLSILFLSVHAVSIDHFNHPLALGHVDLACVQAAFLQPSDELLEVL